MKSESIRTRFTEFFERNRHHRVAPASLVPPDDPSVLFTTAGMQQFKPYFLGLKDAEKDFGGRRLSSIQPCLRTSDIDAVGDASHLTFFEMLGNFSLNDYGRQETIGLAWRFLTEELKLDGDRLWATYFAGEGKLPEDAETARLWRSHLPKARIQGFGREENWWGPAGPSGPCGPCSEIHIDRRGKPCEKGTACRPNCDCGRFLELWNLVFISFEQDARGKLAPLDRPGVDTGMGLERLAAVVQKSETVYETDLSKPLMERTVKDHAFGTEGEPFDTIRRRILCDHLKSVVFLLAAGVQFSNKEQGYVLRRLFRRAVDQFLTPPERFDPYLDDVVKMYGETYAALREQRRAIVETIDRESTAYRKVLALNVDEVVRKTTKPARPPSNRERPGPSHEPLSPKEAFQIYSTYGITPDRLRRAGFSFDEAAFLAEIAKHQERSRQSSTQKFGGHGLSTLQAADMNPEDRGKITKLHTATHLLHAALRKVLGPHVRQQGSDITPERLRFDFEHPEKLTPEQRSEVESLVNEQIRANLPVRVESMPYEEAMRQGALAFFKEKYPEVVSVYSIGDFSKELCGGPHVERTDELETFRIIAEQSVGAGIRRIKAVA